MTTSIEARTCSQTEPTCPADESMERGIIDRFRSIAALRLKPAGANKSIPETALLSSSADSSNHQFLKIMLGAISRFEEIAGSPTVAVLPTSGSPDDVGVQRISVVFSNSSHAMFEFRKSRGDRMVRLTEISLTDRGDNVLWTARKKLSGSWEGTDWSGPVAEPMSADALRAIGQGERLYRAVVRDRTFARKSI